MGNITELSQGNLEGLKKQVCECLSNAYNAGHKKGKLEGLCANTLTNEEKEEVYAKGYEQGKRDLAGEPRFNEEHVRELINKAKQEGYDTGYNEGLKDLTHAMKVYFPLNSKERLDYFGTNIQVEKYATENPKVLISMAKAYEKKKNAEEEIKVGDIVIWEEGRKDFPFIITLLKNQIYVAMNKEGGFTCFSPNAKLKKIGNVSDELQTLIDKLTGDK